MMHIFILYDVLYRVGAYDCGGGSGGPRGEPMSERVLVYVISAAGVLLILWCL